MTGVAWKDDVFHEEILRLEEQIARREIESCSKFILAAQIAVAGGAVVLTGMLVGVIRSISDSWQRESRYCSAALLHGALTVAPQKR